MKAMKVTITNLRLTMLKRYWKVQDEYKIEVTADLTVGRQSSSSLITHDKISLCPLVSTCAYMIRIKNCPDYGMGDIDILAYDYCEVKIL